MSSREDLSTVAQYTDLLSRLRWLVIIFCLAVGIIGFAGANQVSFKNDYRYFFRQIKSSAGGL